METKEEFIAFARERRAALIVQQDFIAEELLACDIQIAALTPPAPEPTPEPVDPPTPVDPDPTPVDPVPVDPTPVPGPGPLPVPTPPVIGGTVAVDASDLMAKITALKGSGKDTTIGLAKGHHSSISLGGFELGGGARLTVVAEDRHASKLAGITLVGGAKNMSFVGIGVCPIGDATPQGPGVKKYGITADDTTAGIVVDDVFCQGHVESANHAWWTLAEWRARAMGGVFLRGTGGVVRNTYAEGVRFGINMSSDGGLVENCRVFGASGDCLRLSAQNLTVRGFLGSDLIYMQDGNHPDGAQAFISDGNRGYITMRGLTIEQIALFDWSVRADNPLRFSAENAKPAMRRWGRMQGIGFHASAFEDMSLVDLYVRTPVANGMHIGGVKNLVGRNWDVLSSDYGQPIMAPATSLSYDTRFPKIDVNASGVVDVQNALAEAYAGNLAGQIVNRRDAKTSDYAVAAPAWVDALRKIAA